MIQYVHMEVLATINLDSIDNSEKSARVCIRTKAEGDREEKEVEAYLYGHSELRKHYAYKISSSRFSAEFGEDLHTYESMYITYQIFAEQFKYDCNTMEGIYAIYPKDREIFVYDIKSYEVNFEENEVCLVYTGFPLYKADTDDETFNMWCMIGFENVSKDMLEEHLRKLKRIR